MVVSASFLRLSMVIIHYYMSEEPDIYEFVLFVTSGPKEPHKYLMDKSLNTYWGNGGGGGGIAPT